MESRPTFTNPAGGYESSTAETIVIDLVYYLRFLWKKKFQIAAIALLGGILAGALSYTRPKMYQATLKFLPPVRNITTISFTLRANPGDEYRAMLTADTIADDVVQHQDLVRYFKVRTVDQARAMVRGMAKFTVDSNSFVNIAVTSTDPDLSMRVANEFYAALYRLTQQIAMREAEHRLAFMSGPLEVERKNLADAELALQQAQQKTGLVLPAAQGALGVQAVASLQSRISDLQAQLARERLAATDENPTVVQLRTQIENLQGQVNSLQSKGSQVNSPARLPELSMEVERREREVRFHTTALDALTRSLQLSQTEASYTPALSLIDPATLPKNKFSPSRSTWVLVGGFLGFCISFLLTLWKAFLRRWGSTPAGAAHLKAIKGAWRDTPPTTEHAA